MKNPINDSDMRLCDELRDRIYALKEDWLRQEEVVGQLKYFLGAFNTYFETPAGRVMSPHEYMDARITMFSAAIQAREMLEKLDEARK